jgi:hypothetical protein
VIALTDVPNEIAVGLAQKALKLWVKPATRR